MNAYSDLTTLKSAGYLEISGTTYDTYLLRMLIAASRFIDNYCERFFFVRADTRYFDGSGKTLWLPDDLLAITTLKTDEDGDGTFENTFASGDYLLYPLNKYPKTHLRISGDSDYGGFGSGVLNSVQIVGSFGYGDGISVTPYTSGGTLGAAISTTSTTSVTMTAGHSIAAGMTALIDTEQLYVSAVATNTLTVRRGVNGTMAATHSNTATVNYYEYPIDVVQACLIQASRWFKRRESAYQDVVGNPETGQVIVYKGLDPDVQLILERYRKRSYP